VFPEIDDLDAAGYRPGQPFIHQIHSNDGVDPLLLGDPARHVADGAQSQDQQGTTIGHSGVLHGLPGGRQDVREIDKAVIRRPLGHQDVGELGLRYAEVFGLTAWHPAVQLGVAEQCSPAALTAYLGRLTLGVERTFTHPAVTAGNLERDDDAIAGTDLSDLMPDLEHDANCLMAQHVPRTHEGAHGLVQMEI
jgi:hypothetical protein